MLLAHLQQLPKVELHCHLLGAVREQRFSQLVQRESAPITPQDMSAFYTPSAKPVGAIRVLRALDQYLIRQEDDLTLIALEYLEDAARHGVRYSEFFWNPTGTVQFSGLSYQQAQAAIIRGIHLAQQQFGVTGRLVAAIDREASPSQALDMVGWVIEHRADDYRENDRPPELFAQAFALARRAGLKLTAHAGEFGLPWHNIETAFDSIGVDRLDHAYTVVDNPTLAARIAERGTVITVVPSNSYYRRTLAPDRWAQDHPIRRMPSMGLRIHPNTDDPTLHFVTPTDAWAMMVKDFGFGRADLLQFMHNGLDGAWMDDSTRRAYKTEFVSAFETLFPEDPV
jgi:adenine deaminase